MKLVDFLGHHMKSDDVVDLLEGFDMRVIYQFDRTHENLADYYDAAAKADGFELRFDEHQVLTTVFCYVKPRGDIAAVDIDFIGVPLLESFADARAYALSNGIKISEPPPASDHFEQWIRLEHDERWDHYQFSDGQLARVTMFLPKAGLRTRRSGS
ncbi:MAG TPA: hypothetical protein VKY31_10025 [Terriglobia bacterium]|nr:hypothetical protein [Terriglobia bacterium]